MGHDPTSLTLDCALKNFLAPLHHPNALIGIGQPKTLQTINHLPVKTLINPI